MVEGQSSGGPAADALGYPQPPGLSRAGYSASPCLPLRCPEIAAPGSSCAASIFVPATGLEPVRPCSGHQHLKLARLPFRQTGVCSKCTSWSFVAQTGFEPVSRGYEPRVEPNSTTAQYLWADLNRRPYDYESYALTS